MEREEQVLRKASEVNAVGEPIPFDEFDILENDTEAYQNRPFENVPVHIDYIERHSDHSIIRAIGLSTYFVLLIDSSDIDLEVGDHGYLSGVVASDVDMSYTALGNIVKGAFKNFDKISEMEYHNPNLTEHGINQTKSNAVVEGTVESILAGDNFTVVYYDYNVTGDYSDFAMFTVKQDGKEIEPVHYSNVGLHEKLDEYNEIFVDLDVTKPFEIEIRDTLSMSEERDFTEEELAPLIFQFNGL
ncbi:hypothetical protein ACLIA0_13725 [Bacillaceae bacterium W0354]